MIAATSTPSLSEFDPSAVPYQLRVIRDTRKAYDYKLGVHEFLLSGSVGSAKSLLLAHLGITHCLLFERARLGIVRKSMPDLKETILAKVLEHIEGDLIEGEDYEHNETKGKITFSNGSEIISRSWADKKFKRLRSLELSAAIVEELTENEDEYKEGYTELRMRVGRLQHVPESWIGCATNPDDPAHWVHKYFIDSKLPTRHVYYSVTSDNKFLPQWYIDQLKTELDPKMARRMIYGEWLSIAQEVIYYAYDRTINFRDYKYIIDERYPISINFDFNIGVGKPMSACFHQFINGEFHFGENYVVEGARTEDILEEMAARGLFDYNTRFLVRGDATGRARNTASKHSNYDIIRNFLSNHKNKHGQTIRFEMQVPLSNPPIRTRHNTMNAQMKNANGEHRLFVYADAQVLDEGFRLTKLKEGGQYLEDDSKRFQHVTTAAGYGVCTELLYSKRQPQHTVEL